MQLFHALRRLAVMPAPALLVDDLGARDCRKVSSMPIETVGRLREAELEDVFL